LGCKYINDPVSLGEKIRNKRLELGWLQKELAIFIGVCEDSITGWENNRARPQKQSIPEISVFLNKQRY